MYRFFIISTILFLLLFSCGEKQQKMESNSSIRPVKIVEAEELGSIARQYTGVVKATDFSVLAFKISGTITKMDVIVGEKIKKGQIIAQIDSKDYQLEYETAQANYKTSKSIYERSKRLVAADAVALQNLEIAEADYVRATSTLSIAKRTLDYTNLSAPFSGFIEEKQVNTFEEIQAGQAIVRLVNPEDVEVHFLLPESNIQLLDYPKEIYVEFDSQKGKLFTADVKEYVDASDGFGIPITLTITDEQFTPYRKNVYPGFSCKVIWEVVDNITTQFMIPPSALQIKEGKEYIWLVDPSTQTVHSHEVKTSRLAGHIFVTSGLQKQDLIITAGILSLSEGQKVAITE